MEDIIFKYADFDDYSAIKNLMSKCFDFYASKDEFSEYIKKHNILIASYKNKIVAYAIYEIIVDCFSARKILFLKYLGVEQDFQNKGIGKIVINRIKEIANDSSLDAIELTCADFRQASHKFYESNNFSIKKTKVFIYELFNEKRGGVSKNNHIAYLPTPHKIKQLECRGVA